MSPPPEPLRSAAPVVVPPEGGRVLVEIAREALAEELGRGRARRRDAPWLRERAATFVTLSVAGVLRGCVGTLDACRPLADDVRSNAVAAGFRDPRFPPLTAEELPGLEVEVSMLTPLEPLAPRDEAELLRLLRPGIDGVLVELAGRRGTFLPQVWEHLREPAEFLAQLRRKAGLGPAEWSPEMRWWRYGVVTFG